AVVVGRVRRAVDICRGYQRHELMRDLIRERVSYERNVRVRLQRSEDEAEHCVTIGRFKITPLLNIGILIDDARFQRREICGDIGRQIVSDVFLEAILARTTGRKRIASGGRAFRDHAFDGGEIQLEGGEIRSKGNELAVETGGLTSPRANQTISTLQL